MNYYSISIVIPTLNSAKTLDKCLNSIIVQDYPKDKLEIIFTDGGSVDNTLEIIKSLMKGISYKILDNPLRTGEAGKAVGVKAAKNEIIALIDSDNILPRIDWLKLMIEPYSDSNIAASEPIEYTYRRSDGYITRYCALIGMNDPLCIWLGNYDRICLLTNKWTEINHKEEDNGNYIKITFPNPERLPTIGANGFFIKRDILLSKSIGDYLFDIDILQEILQDRQIAIAKVKTGTIHLFSGATVIFLRKQLRRIRDYNYYKSRNLRKYRWDKMNKTGIYSFIFDIISILPLFFQSIKGYLKKRDIAWFYHPIACWVTFFSYGIGTISSMIHKSPQNRNNWKQF